MDDLIYETIENEGMYVENENDNDPENASVLKKKNRNYKQRYRKQWEKDERLKLWITQCKEDPNYAYCMACNLKLTTRLAAILKHYKTDKHQKKMELVSYLLFNTLFIR